MKLFSGRNTCFQCDNVFSDSNLYCPNCGARRQENNAAIFVRRLRRVGLCALLGGAVGVIGVVILGRVFPDWSADALTRFPVLPSQFGLELIGFILGGLVGGFIYTAKECSRES